jgi:hypothetical protein
MKKYAPYIFLLIGATAIFVIKTNQRGHSASQDQMSVNVPATISSNDSTAITTTEGFNRYASYILYSKHARCRMECRHITEAEVKEILVEGKVNEHKEKEDERGTTYPLEGIADGHHLRIVFAPKGDIVEVVTCIDLDTDWPCDCGSTNYTN